jgi:CheY-like chemotaxis protein
MRISTAALPVSGEFVRVSVQDTGPGIPSDVLPKIFQSFYSTKETGHGIGLSTVRSIMDWHKGYIDVVTAPDAGSTFTVLFPIHVQAPVLPPLPTLTQGNDELILVAEDEESSLILMREILEGANYRMLGAHCGSEAYAIYKQRAADIAVVVSDAEMPSISGPELAGLLREINPSVRILAISGAGSDPALASSMKCERMLSKPFTSQALLDVLHEVCSKP